jgi:hypothetical protein
MFHFHSAQLQTLEPSLRGNKRLVQMHINGLKQMVSPRGSHIAIHATNNSLADTIIWVFFHLKTDSPVVANFYSELA